jgi:ParB family chromosome partitioning protein
VSKEKRLGRGLEALLGAASIPVAGPAGQPPLPGTPQSSSDVPRYTAASLTPAATEVASAVKPAAETNRPQRIAIDQIVRNPHQPRQEFDPEELKQLSESLASHGLLQPVVVRPWQGKFQLIAGERRLRAARQAGWADVPVTIIEADDRQMTELAIVENLQRKDLNALEKAASFQAYIDQYRCTQEELAGRLRIDRSTVANFIRLLELPEAVQDALRRGKITPGHARALLPLGDEREQIDFCQRIQNETWSVRHTESMVQEAIAAADNGPAPIAGTVGKGGKPILRGANHVSNLEQEFRAALGLKVKITTSSRGKGKLVIAFASHEEFEQLRDYICGVVEPVHQAKAG